MPVLSKPRGCLLLPPAPTGELGLDTKQECIPVSFSSKSRTSPDPLSTGDRSSPHTCGWRDLPKRVHIGGRVRAAKGEKTLGQPDSDALHDSCKRSPRVSGYSRHLISGKGESVDARWCRGHERDPEIDLGPVAEGF